MLFFFGDRPNFFFFEMIGKNSDDPVIVRKGGLVNTVMASFNIITGRITNMSEKNTYVLLESAVSAKSAVSLL